MTCLVFSDIVPLNTAAFACAISRSASGVAGTIESRLTATPGSLPAAVALAAGRLPGVAVSLDSIVPATPDAERLIAQANAAVLSGTMSENTKQVIRRQISDISDPLQA